MNTHTYFYSMLALLILLGCTQDSLQPLDGFTEKSITTFKVKTSQTQKASDAVDYEALLAQAANTPISALFAGGRIYQKINRTKGEKDTQQKSPLEEIKTSGFTTLILFTIHIQDNGNLMLNNDFPLVSNGVYIGDQTHPNFRAHMLYLLTDEKLTVKRLEISLSAAGSGTFNHIRDRLFFTSRPKAKFILGSQYRLGKFVFNLNNTYFGKTTFKQDGLNENLRTEFVPKIITDLAVVVEIANKTTLILNSNNLFNILPEWEFVEENAAGQALIEDTSLTSTGLTPLQNESNLITFNQRYAQMTYDGFHFSQLGTLFNLSLNYRF